MPYKNMQDGLYLLKQESSEKGVSHYGILDIGNRIQHPEININHPLVVIHQTPPIIRLDWLQNTGSWQVLGRIANENEEKAKNRLNSAYQNPTYNLFGNNCEHFARYVATGIKESHQVQAAATIGGLVALSFILINAVEQVDCEN
jgi:hypothetical protein